MADLIDPAGVLALVGAMIGILWVVVLAFYVFMALALMAMAKRTNTPNGWLAWIPIGNFVLMAQIAKAPVWYILGFFVPGLSIIVMIYLWWKIAEAVGRPGWFSLLMLIPVVNFVVIGIMAWGK